MNTKVTVTYHFDDEEAARAHLGLTTRNPDAVSTETRAAAPTGDEPTADSRDADGMPYNEDVHASPPQFTEKGLWRSKRGKAPEADAARAAFKAAGGNITPPTVAAEAPTPVAAPVVAAAATPAAPAPVAAPAPAPVAPVVAAAPAAPALPPDMPEPVTAERLFAALGAAANAGVDIGEIYDNFIGSRDQGTTTQAMLTNESLRANMMRHLESLAA